MANTYTWSISGLLCYPTEKGEADVVFTVNWGITADDGLGHEATILGSQLIPLDSSSPFTPFNDLTETQVIGWVQSAMGPETVDSYYAGLDRRIQDMISPPVISPTLPWATT